LTLFFLATPLLFPHAFLLFKLRFILCTKRVSKFHRGKREREREHAYRFGTHPSLVEYEPRGLLGLG
jgi:hypothetical protein